MHCMHRRYVHGQWRCYVVQKLSRWYRIDIVRYECLLGVQCWLVRRQCGYDSVCGMFIGDGFCVWIIILLQLRCWLLRELTWIVIVHTMPCQHVQPQLRCHVIVGLPVVYRFSQKSQRLLSVLRCTAHTNHPNMHYDCWDRPIW